LKNCKGAKTITEHKLHTKLWAERDVGIRRIPKLKESVGVQNLHFIYMGSNICHRKFIQEDYIFIFLTSLTYPFFFFWRGG
jgi:hypothetical protein